METLGTEAAGNTGLMWVSQAILSWGWHTMILEVGRIALGLARPDQA